MTPLLFAMVASFLAATGRATNCWSRGLQGLGRGNGLLVVALASSATTATIAAWAGAMLARTMPESAATMFVAIALLLAAGECAYPIASAPCANRPGRWAPWRSSCSPPADRCLGSCRRIRGGVRHLAAGGAGWGDRWRRGSGARPDAGGQLESRLPLRGLRIALAVVLLAVLTGLSARGIIG